MPHDARRRRKKDTPPPRFRKGDRVVIRCAMPSLHGRSATVRKIRMLAELGRGREVAINGVALERAWLPEDWLVPAKEK